MHQAVSALSFHQRLAKTVVVKIAGFAEPPVEGGRGRLFAFPEKKEPGIDRRAQVVVARVKRRPWLNAVADALGGHVAHFSQREEHVAVAHSECLVVKLADRLVRLPGRQAVEIEAVQDRNGFRTGLPVRSALASTCA